MTESAFSLWFSLEEKEGHGVVFPHVYSFFLTFTSRARLVIPLSPDQPTGRLYIKPRSGYLTEASPSSYHICLPNLPLPPPHE